MKDRGYDLVSVDLLPDSPSYAAHKKDIGEAAGATEFTVALYTAIPGESISLGYHRHPDHEKLFYLIQGTIAFETDDGGFWIEEGEAFFVPADAPYRCRAAGDTAARVIAIEAPKTTNDVVFSEHCPACGEKTDRQTESVDGDSGSVLILRCATCGAETDRVRPGLEIAGEPCPECGETTNRAEETTDDEGQRVYVISCVECGAEIDRLRPEQL